MRKSTMIVGILFDIAILALALVLSAVYMEGVWKLLFQGFIVLWAAIDIHSGIEAKIAIDHRTSVQSPVARIYLAAAYRLGNFLFERR